MNQLALPLTRTYTKAEGQPTETDIYVDDDLFVKTYGPLRRGDVVQQHSHEYAHATVVVAGSFAVRCGDDDYLGVSHAGQIVAIPANTIHTFMAISDGSMLACFHNLHGHGYPSLTKD